MLGLTGEGSRCPLAQVSCHGGLEHGGGQFALRAVDWVGLVSCWYECVVVVVVVDGVGLVSCWYKCVVVVVVVVEVVWRCRRGVVHVVCQRRRACGLALGCCCDRGRTMRVVIVAGEVPRWGKHGRWSRVWLSTCW